MSEYKPRAYSRLKWKDMGDGTNRQRFEKAGAWHFTFEKSDKAAYAKGYDGINWTNGPDEEEETETTEIPQKPSQES